MSKPSLYLGKILALNLVARTHEGSTAAGRRASRPVTESSQPAVSFIKDTQNLRNQISSLVLAMPTAERTTPTQSAQLRSKLEQDLPREWAPVLATIDRLFDSDSKCVRETESERKPMDKNHDMFALMQDHLREIDAIIDKLVIRGAASKKRSKSSTKNAISLPVDESKDSKRRRRRAGSDLGSKYDDLKIAQPHRKGNKRKRSISAAALPKIIISPLHLRRNFLPEEGEMIAVASPDSPYIAPQKHQPSPPSLDELVDILTSAAEPEDSQ